MSIQEPRQNCYGTQTLSFLTPISSFPLYPTGVISLYRFVYVCWAYITTITNSHVPKAPLFSLKETLAFTLYCHLLCQVKQRTCSFNALAVPCHDFHLLYIESKMTMNLSKSLKKKKTQPKHHHVALPTAKLCIIFVCKSESQLCKLGYRHKELIVLGGRGVMLYCARPDGRLQPYLQPLHWVYAGQ